MEDMAKEIKKLEDDLKEVENSCADDLLGHPYNRKIYKECGDKITSLKNEIEKLEKEEIKKRAKELEKEIDNLRKEREKRGKTGP
jgi:chaperonin cofactor prefoldin